MYNVLQVFGVGVHDGSAKDIHKKDSILIVPRIQSIKLTQTQVLSASCISLLFLYYNALSVFTILCAT